MNTRFLLPVSVLLAAVTLTFNLRAQITSGDWIYTLGGPNEARIVGYAGQGGAVIIPSSINGNQVKRLESLNFGESIFGQSSTTVTSVTIPASVAIIGAYAFNRCPALTSVTIPEGVTVIGEAAFGQCTALTSFTIPKSVTFVSFLAFSDCTALTSINVAAENPSYSSIGGVLFNKNATTLVAFPAGKAGAYAIPDSVTMIDEGAFSGSASLTSITIPNSVTAISSYVFLRCTALNNVTIPHSVNYISNEAFWSCSSLTSINVAAENPSYSSIGGVLFNKNATTLVAFPAGKAGAYAIPDSVTYIMQLAFYQSASLTGVTIPDSVTAIPYGAFFQCAALTIVSIADSVTSIGSYAFLGCNALTSLTIPDSITNIGSYAFADCTALTSVYFIGDMPSFGSVLFDGISPLGIVYYLAGATTWGMTFDTWPTQELSVGQMVNAISSDQFDGGQASVINNPAAFGLFTEQDFNDNYLYGISNGVSAVLFNPEGYGLYTADSIMDLRMGGLMIQRQGTNATVVFQPQTTTDLTQPFTNSGTPITNQIPMPGNKGFLRIQAR